MTQPSPKGRPSPATANEQLVAAVLKKDPREYEGAILHRLLCDRRFFIDRSPTICRKSTAAGKYAGEWCDDFQTSNYNAIYRAHVMVLEASDNHEQEFPPNPSKVEAILRAAASGSINRFSVIEAAVPLILADMAAVITRDKHEIRGIEDALIREWIFRVRITDHAETWTKTPGFGAVKLVEALSAELSHIGSTGKNKDALVDFGVALDTPEAKSMRFPSSWPELNVALGGGYSRGEGTLWIGPSGGGKTVVACQEALSFVALSGLKGLYISTEQSPRKLEPRFIANFCDVDYNRIKDQFDADKLTPPERLRYTELRALMKGKFMWVPWSVNRSRSILVDLPSIIDDAARRLDGIDFVILDWIGSAIGEGVTDASEKRLLLHNTAKFMADIAEQRQIITLSFAQANPEKGVDNPRITSETVHECKSLHMNMTNVIGISALWTEDARAKSRDYSPDKAVQQYRAKQVFWVSKSRQSGFQGSVPVVREFQFQRFRANRGGAPG